MANKIYRALETALVFKDSGGDAVITLQNLAFAAGRVSAQYDRGAGSKPQYYIVKAAIQYATTPQIGEVTEIYIYESNGTLVDGTVGTADAALGSDKLRNGHQVLTSVVDVATASVDMIGSALIMIADRYFSVGVWNRSTGDNLRNSANTCSITLIPFVVEVQ